MRFISYICIFKLNTSKKYITIFIQSIKFDRSSLLHIEIKFKSKWKLILIGQPMHSINFISIGIVSEAAVSQKGFAVVLP